MNIKRISIIVTIIALAITNVYSVLSLNSAGRTILSMDDMESLADTERSDYENARNQFCRKPKGEKGCVDDEQRRGCTYTIFCIE